MTDEKQEFHQVLTKFDTAMLVTRSKDQLPRARPMAIAAAQEDGDVWFATSVESPKVDEILGDDRVAVTFQSKQQFLSISGHAELVKDRAKIHELWREQWKVWFPNGKDDPEIVLIHLRAEEAEYWDQHGTKGMRYLFEAGKALLGGHKPGTRSDQHAKLNLG